MRFAYGWSPWKEGNILKREREKGKVRRGESEREKGGKEGKRERTGRHVW